MSNVNPNYKSVSKSGVSSQETPSSSGAPYSQVAKSGVANPGQSDSAPPVPASTPAQDQPYSQIKN